jgi:hypothetical protein
MATLKPYPFLLGFIVLFYFVRPTLAFGAGNIAGISKIEGQNCEQSLTSSIYSSSVLTLTFISLLLQGATAISKMPSSRLPWPAWPAAKSSTS